MEELSLVINQPDEGKFLTKIGWNKEQIKSVVKGITKQYHGLTYTDEQIQDAKRDRATLNALKKDISDRRIQVKKALMAPYDVFETEVKEVIALIDEPISMIDKQLIVYEEKVKEDKRKELLDYFNEHVGELTELLTFDMIFNSKWLNKTASFKSCKEEINEIISITNTDLETIENVIDDKYKEYAKDYYFRMGRNMAKVLNEIGRMKEIDRKAEDKKAIQKETKEVIAECDERNVSDNSNLNTEVENSNQLIKDDSNVKVDDKTSISPERAIEQGEYFDDMLPKHNTQSQKMVTEEKRYKATFWCRGTFEQIRALSEYMKINNIEFGKVEK